MNLDNTSSNLFCLLRTYGFIAANTSQQTLFEQMRISALKEDFANLSLDVFVEPAHQLYYSRSGSSILRYFLRRRPPIYHALLPHLSFAGDGLRPVWVNSAGRAVIAWHPFNGRKKLLIGLNVVDEMIRHRQGNPENVLKKRERSAWGYDNERSLYLFEEQLLSDYRTIPWADNLGFLLARMFSTMSGLPLFEPLPYGAKGAVILTGDDDQAALSDYAEQLSVIGHIPVTYFLHPLTHHTATTIKNLPPNVELGLHPDALDQPEAYDEVCLEQAEKIEDLARRPLRLVRNHGFLNRGYLGHLEVWEKLGLRLDVNYPGVDGTALNGSFLPTRVLCPDGTWSDHYSLLTAFGDGMIYALKLSQRQAKSRIMKLARQIETTSPGVLVFNFHPANIADTRELHQTVLILARRSGWIALGLESYLSWLEMMESLQIEVLGPGRLRLTTVNRLDGLVLKYPINGAWHKKRLAPLAGKAEVHIN
jgi:hypothetical protein